MAMWTGIAALVVLLSGVATICFCRRVIEIVGGVTVGLFMLLVGVSHTAVSYHQTTLQPELQDSTAFYRCRLCETPRRKNSLWQAEAEVLWRIDSVGLQPVDRRVLLSLSDSTCQAVCGDYLVLQTRLQVPCPADEYSFDYGRYLRLTGIAGTAYSSCYSIVGHQSPRGLRPLMQRLRDHLEERFAAIQWRGEPVFQPREMGVVEALVLGDRHSLDPDVRAAFSAAGAMHVLAVSGLHVSILIGIILWLLTLGGRRKTDYDNYSGRYLQCALAVMLLWMYALLTGLSVSVVRSSLMFTLLFFGQIYRPGRLPMNEVAASAWIILLFDPFALLQSSFLLSYSAVVAILMLIGPMRRLVGIKGYGEKACFPRLESYPRLNKAAIYLTDIFLVSLAAQIGTLPWTLYFFGQLSSYFALTNFLVLPLVALLMRLVLLLMLLGGIPLLGPLLAVLSQWLTWILNEAVGWVCGLPGSMLGVSITPLMTAALLGIAVGIMVVPKNRRAALAIMTIMLLVLTVAYSVDFQRAAAERTLHYYSNRRATTVMVQDGRNVRLLTTNPDEAMRQTSDYRLGRHILAVDVIPLDTTRQYVGFQWNGGNYLLQKQWTGRYVLTAQD